MPDALPPVFLATAIESVIRAGAIQMAHFGGDLRVDKKGAIDLVTEIDLQVEREFRALHRRAFSRSRRARRGILEQRGSRRASPEYCWVFDPVDGTTNYAHGLPIFCSSLALEIDGVPAVAAIYDPTRRELFTAERGQGAWLNGAPLRVSSATHADRLAAVHGLSLQRAARRRRARRPVRASFSSVSRAVRRLGSAAIDLCYVAAGRLDGFWEQSLHPWDVAAGALIIQEAGGRVTDLAGGPYQFAGRQPGRHATVTSTTRWSRSFRAFRCTRVSPEP